MLAAEHTSTPEAPTAAAEALVQTEEARRIRLADIAPRLLDWA